MTLTTTAPLRDGVSTALDGFTRTDSGLHLPAEQQKLHHLKEFHRLCGNHLYVDAYEAWQELNWRYFNGSLNCPLIEIGITPYGAAAGLYCPDTNPGHILLHQTSGLNQATLQHEMGHQWQHQIGLALYPLMGGKGGRSDWHHCQSWAAFCEHTDRVDQVERGRYIWQKQTTKTTEGIRHKGWNYFLPDGSKLEAKLPTDRIGATNFHSKALAFLRLDGSPFSDWERDAWLNSEAEM